MTKNALIRHRGTIGILQYTQDEISDIYRRNITSVYRLCFSYLKNREDAQDACQTVFMKLMQSGKRFDSLTYERAWLLRTAINTCIDKLRHWWNKTQSFNDSDFAVFFDDGGYDDLFSAVSSLPEKYRTPTLLYYYGGYKCSEIAALLSIPCATVRTRLSRARALLKKALAVDTDEKACTP